MATHVNKNVDIQFSSHDSFLEQTSTGTLLVKRLKSQIIERSLGASAPKGISRIANMGECRICLRGGTLLRADHLTSRGGYGFFLKNNFDSQCC
jgi:hypothetical protein